jgi:hypothetical protein
MERRGKRQDQCLRIEQIVFGDGAMLTPDHFQNLPVIGTQGDDVIVGSDVADVIIGGAGNAANDSEWRNAA